MRDPIGLGIITLLPAVSSLSAATHYVSLKSANPTPPYTNWVTAATNYSSIQRSPFYPGAGAAQETGTGKGPGFTRS